MTILKPLFWGAGAVWRLAPDFEVPRSLRALVRARESSLILIAGGVGALAGLVVACMSLAVTELHWLLFSVPPGERLSGQTKLDPVVAIAVPLVGGLLFGIGAYARAHQGAVRGGG